MASRAEEDFKDIQDIFDREGVSFDPRLDAWKVQGTPVVYHKALERLAARMGIVFDDPKMMVQEADDLVMFVRGRRVIGKDADNKDITRSEWTFAEISMNRTGANYRFSGKQAGYPWAMLEKRGKDRVILKLAGIEAYSEDEADEFKEEGRRHRQDTSDQTSDRGRDQDERRDDRHEDRRDDVAATASQRRGRSKVEKESERSDGKPDAANDDSGSVSNDVILRLKAAIDGKETVDDTAAFMLNAEVQKALNAMNHDDRELVRDYAKKHLGKLGFPLKDKQAS